MKYSCHTVMKLVCHTVLKYVCNTVMKYGCHTVIKYDCHTVGTTPLATRQGLIVGIGIQCKWELTSTTTC